MALENTETTIDPQNSVGAAPVAQPIPAAEKKPGNSDKKRLIIIAVAVIVIIAIVALVYYALSGFGRVKEISGSQVFNSASNESLNATQTRFLTDLKRSQNITTIHVTYYSNNRTTYEQQSGNLTVATNTNQSVDSYVLNGEGKSVFTNIVSYVNTRTGALIMENRSSIYYYNTSSNTITCLNQSTYISGVAANSSLSCNSGDGGLFYLDGFPFTVTNVTSLALIVYQGRMGYQGTKTIDGRNCDNYIFINGTSTSKYNYSVLDLCIDLQYGIPLYFNETQVAEGVPSSASFIAVNVSTDVPASDFVIPTAYLDKLSSSA